MLCPYKCGVAVDRSCVVMIYNDLLVLPVNTRMRYHVDYAKRLGFV